MHEILSLIYFWLKAGHVIFVIFWMAGLFMLPRYYIYHQEAAPDSPERERWIDREAKLRKIILTPSLVVVWVLGLALALSIGAFSQGWFHAKLALVVLLTAYHGWMVGYGRKLERGEETLSGKRLRLLNEVPSLAAVLIVILVVVKPF
jgi:putative membrane protein